MNTRQGQLLVAIIDQFITSGVPVGSKQIIDHGYFLLSCATIRNEMQVLGDQGFIEQPHVSAGRIPTAKGYRAYVQDFMRPSVQEKKVRERFNTLREQYFHRKDQERAFEAVTLLSHMIPDVAFATVPHKEQVYYVGLANVLRQPEFLSDPTLASGVVEVLESRLSDLLSRIDVDEKVRYYIGEKNLLREIHSCGMMVTTYKLRSEGGVIGILGPMRMDYAYNTVALDLVAGLLRSA